MVTNGGGVLQRRMAGAVCCSRELKQYSGPRGGHAAVRAPACNTRARQAAGPRSRATVELKARAFAGCALASAVCGGCTEEVGGAVLQPKRQPRIKTEADLQQPTREAVRRGMITRAPEGGAACQGHERWKSFPASAHRTLPHLVAPYVYPAACREGVRVGGGPPRHQNGVLADGRPAFVGTPQRHERKLAIQFHRHNLWGSRHTKAERGGEPMLRHATPQSTPVRDPDKQQSSVNGENKRRTASDPAATPQNALTWLAWCAAQPHTRGPEAALCWGSRCAP